MIKKIINKIRVIKQGPVKNLEDEFLAWLTFSNAGMLTPGNSYCMDYAISRLPTNNPVIEIGSFCGLSTNVMSYLLEKHLRANQIITSDRWIFEGAENGGTLGDSNILHRDYRTFVMDTFKRNISFFGRPERVHPIEVFSDDFFKLWEAEATVENVFSKEVKLGGNISFAYIDGNHSYEFAKRDFQNVSKYLDKGGFILFDDSSDLSTFGCAKLMKEIVRDSSYELVMKNPNYLFRKIK
ncbi:MAG: hypothetical protein ACJA2S_005575 [Cyclobacteriaceae bacterium]|jgi:hypothetical protein